LIRLLNVEEVELCLDGGRLFFAEGKIPGGFVPEAFVFNWRRLITQGHGAILGQFDAEGIAGALGAVLAPDLNNNDLLATECFMYSLPHKRGNGLRLLLAFEEWARQMGAKRVAMIHLLSLQPERLASLYHRMGYAPMEVNYVKAL
jgi:GNAT superfamily N-acetyltransferase